MTEGYVEIVYCPAEDAMRVEVCDRAGHIRHYSEDAFREAFAEHYDEGDLDYAMGCIPTGPCSCCQWGQA